MHFSRATHPELCPELNHSAVNVISFIYERFANEANYGFQEHSPYSVMKFLKVYFYKCLACSRKRCPKCVSLCWPEDSVTNQVIRSFLLYFYGILLGGLFWRFVLLNIGFPFDSVFLVGVVISLLLGEYSYSCSDMYAFSLNVHL